MDEEISLGTPDDSSGGSLTNSLIALINGAGKSYVAYQNASAQQAVAQRARLASAGTTKLLMIGAAVVGVIVLVLALRR